MKKSIFHNLIALVPAVLVLFGLSFGLKGVAAANAEEDYLKKMQILMPGSETFVEEPYAGEDANIRAVYKGDTGFVIETATRGYADEIVMLIGVSNDGEVIGLTVLNMHETFGLGGKSLKDWKFLAQFLLTSGNTAVRGSDSDAEVFVDSITGATVTSKAIVRCVNSAAAYVTGADVGSGATSWGG